MEGPDGVGEVTVRDMDLEGDLEALTEAMREAFDDDSRRFRGTDGGGPPGYDDGTFLRRWAAEGKGYTVLLSGIPVGSVIVFPRPGDVSVLGNISVHPAFQDRGVGSTAMALVEARHPDCRVWRLDTPEWATRNHHFYRKNGYRLVGRTSEEGGSTSLVFEKDLENPVEARAGGVSC